ALADPEAARRLSANDLVRVSRALEVFELTGVPMSRWQSEHGFRQARYVSQLMGITRTSSELDQRIHARVRAMLANGWVEEVRRLLDEGLGGARAMGAVGYRQIVEAIHANTAHQTHRAMHGH